MVSISFVFNSFTDPPIFKKLANRSHLNLGSLKGLQSFKANICFQCGNDGNFKQDCHNPLTCLGCRGLATRRRDVEQTDLRWIALLFYPSPIEPSLLRSLSLSVMATVSIMRTWLVLGLSKWYPSVMIFDLSAHLRLPKLFVVSSLDSNRSYHLGL